MVEKSTGNTTWFWIGGFVVVLYLVGNYNSGNQMENSKSNGVDPDVATKTVMDNLMSTPHGRAEVERIGGKDVELARFQSEQAISDRIAEAAIKEWVITHQGNFDWNLADVKAICLRNKQSGIPRAYLPESEK